MAVHPGHTPVPGASGEGATDPRRRGRALGWALAANATLLVAEAVGGIVFGSLALLADAAHMLSDVAALGLALIAERLSGRAPTDRHSYGLQRAEVLAAQANGLLLLAAGAWIVVEAVGRFGQGVEVEGMGLLVVATAGLLVNVGSAVGLSRVRGGNLNIRGAMLHLASDAAGSVAAILAGVAVLAWDATWVDPAASLFVVALVAASAVSLLRETTHVLLEGVPRGLEIDEITRALADHPEVEAVHHVHAWSLASDVPSLSAHIVVERDVSLHDAQVLGDQLKERIRDRFGIEHATLELECHACESEGDAVTDAQRR